MFARFFRSSEEKKGRKKEEDKDTHSRVRRRKGKGILHAIRARALHGPTSFTRFTHFSAIPSLLDRNLARHSEGTWMEAKDLLVLWEKQENLGLRLIDSPHISASLEKLFLLISNANEDLYVRRADEILGFGVLSALVNIISSDQPLSGSTAPTGGPAPWHASQLLSITLFRETLYLTQIGTMSHHGIWGSEFLKTVLRRASDDALFEASIGLLEELLVMDGDVLESSIDLSEVPEFLDMLENASPRNLSFACRILPLFVFDQNEKMEKALGDAHGVEQMEKIAVTLRSNRPLLSTKNQSILLSRPRIIERIFDLLHLLSLPQVRHVHRLLVQGISDQVLSIVNGDIIRMLLHRRTGALSRPRIIERIFDLLHLLSLPQVRHVHRLLVQGISDQVLSIVNGDIIRMLLHRRTGALSTWESSMEHVADSRVDRGLRDPARIEKHLDWTTQDSFTIASNESEILLLVASLLSSRRKEQLRDKSVERNISKYVKDLMQIMNWDPQLEPRSAPHPLHGPGCTCNMDSSMKIQLMRVLHALVDRADPTALCLTQAASFQLPTLVVALMKSSPPHSEYKYWMRSCLEAFVRSAGVKAQMTLIHDGLLDSLLSDLMMPTFKGSGSLQTAFDLLGELIKFNVFAFRQLDSVLVDPVSFSSFYNVVMGSLVDSNVFLRSLYLSARYFSTHGSKKYDMRSSPLIRFLEEESEIVGALMESVTPDKISQENMCCLNTAVLFCLLARKEGRLGELLDRIRRMKNGTRSFQAFEALLHFWRRNYLRRGRDCHSLEKSTRIHFSHWRSVVGVLLSHDVLSPDSLYFQPLPTGGFVAPCIRKV
eukprot:TRINITY_DN15666_c0_g2_i1.p1 TRINITY_DN15666_c0_g2~~TRINITY_DN15666_c0_g2_i1.p1  ORF type:complete len:828 (-),score=178.61 TRINITY_DN15666_c0_g2_i1:62-2545(-)